MAGGGEVERGDEGEVSDGPAGGEGVHDHGGEEEGEGAGFDGFDGVEGDCCGCCRSCRRSRSRCGCEDDLVDWAEAGEVGGGGAVRGEGGGSGGSRGDGDASIGCIGGGGCRFGLGCRGSGKGGAPRVGFVDAFRASDDSRCLVLEDKCALVGVALADAMRFVALLT